MGKLITITNMSLPTEMILNLVDHAERNWPDLWHEHRDEIVGDPCLWVALDDPHDRARQEEGEEEEEVVRQSVTDVTG